MIVCANKTNNEGFVKILITLVNIFMLIVKFGANLLTPLLYKNEHFWCKAKMCVH
jgi:hypothetical protein